MEQERVTQVLDIERRALQIHRDAEQRAEQILETARVDAAELRDRVLAAAHEEADQMVEQAREDAEAERQGILAQAEQKASELESSARGDHDQAVSFVVDRVAGRE